MWLLDIYGREGDECSSVSGSKFYRDEFMIVTRINFLLAKSLRL